MSSELPGRYLMYTAGPSTPLFVRIVNDFARELGADLEVLHILVGDLYYYRWAQAQTLHPRIVLHYQHETMDPFRRPVPLDRGRLAEFEERYGAPNLWRYIRAQRIIDRLDDDAKVRYLQTYLEYFEDLWHRVKPDVFISGIPDMLPFLAAFQVFSRNGAIPLVVMTSRFPGRMIVIDNEIEQIPGLLAEADALRGRALTPAERAVADGVREQFVVRKHKPAYFVTGVRTRALPSPLRAVKAQWRRYRYDDWFVTPWFRDDLRASLNLRARWPLQRRALRRLERPLPDDDKFFYYPLHFEPEALIDLLGTQVRDQLKVIRRVSEALPAGYTLCVKEHPWMSPGARPLGYYDALAALGNVRLLETLTDGYEVIRRCRGVVTIAGTAGWEALFYGKRVLVLGRAFYDAFADGVTRTTTLEPIAETLLDMLRRPEVDAADLDRFVVALHRRSYPGLFALSSPGVDAPSNHTAVARAMVAELRLRLAWRAAAQPA